MIWRLLSIPLLLWALGFAVFVIALPGPAGDERTDAIVVPTGGQGRIQRGLALLDDGRAKRVLITGVDRQVRPNELAAANKVSRRLIRCCVDLGREAVDTRSNGEETARWVAKRKYTSVRLVTTDWHMPRARFELERVLPADVTILADAVPSRANLVVLVKEYNKFLLRRSAVVLGI